MGTGAKSSSSGLGGSVAGNRGEGRGLPTPNWPLCLNKCCLFTRHGDQHTSSRDGYTQIPARFALSICP